MATNNSVNNGLSGSTGSGSFVGSTSPALTTPNIDTPSTGVLTNCTGLPLTSGITGILSLANGGTNANLTASNGGIVYSTSTGFGILSGVASNGKILQSVNGGSPLWSTPTYPSISGTAGTILISGGVNITYTSATYPTVATVNQILYGSATNVVSGLATANNGVFYTDINGAPSINTLGNSKVLASNSGGTVAARAFSINIVSVTSTSTYTPSAGTVAYQYEILGGGGGGGGTASTSASQFAAAAGGGAGEYVRGFSTSAAGVSVTIGTAGSGGSAGANNGTAGNTTTFGSVTALGGNAGSGRTAQTTGSSTVGATGGGGGTGGTLRIPGNAGGTGNCVTAGNLTSGGYGANSQYGNGGLATVASAGVNAGGYGAGGSGASAGASASAAAGGNGTAGVVIITEFIIN